MRVRDGRAAAAEIARIETRSSSLQKVEPQVRRIIRAIRRDGDKALTRYATTWDSLQPKQSLRVSAQEIAEAAASVPAETRRALRVAAAKIRRFCEWQMPQEWRRKLEGSELGQLIRPLQSVGCYVPGGRYPLPSTLLMTVIPAQVAGVPRICVVSPRPQPATLAAADLLGVREIYRCGGAQAIAALAYGTETIAPVQKILGPGNSFVTAAKRQVSSDCSIDMLAGPTEAVFYSNTGNPGFIAADMVAQAEHDPEALVVFLTTRANLASEVRHALKLVARGNSTAKEALRLRGAILIASSENEATDWINRIAPEHLTVDNERLLPFVKNAGSIFVGDYSAQSTGDYAAGPNHVLPTGGAARYRGGLSVCDFLKVITVQKFDRAGLREIAPAVVTLAATEGLRGHAESIRVRCGNA